MSFVGEDGCVMPTAGELSYSCGTCVCARKEGREGKNRGDPKSPLLPLPPSLPPSHPQHLPITFIFTGRGVEILLLVCPCPTCPYRLNPKQYTDCPAVDTAECNPPHAIETT